MYVNRKGAHTINVQEVGLVDFFTQFLAVSLPAAINSISMPPQNENPAYKSLQMLLDDTADLFTKNKILEYSLKNRINRPI